MIWIQRWKYGAKNRSEKVMMTNISAKNNQREDYIWKKIGKVILDTTCYPGKDLYSDGAIEDEMLAISRDFAPEEFNRAISERKSWPILYHFSHIRRIF